jgi:hypothetical protein
MSKRRVSGGIPASALGAAAASAELLAKQTAMSQARTRIARGEIVNLSPYGEVWMQLLGNAKMEEIEAATFQAMTKLGLPPVDLHLGTYNLHRFRRILAAAVRPPGDHDEPFGTLEEWGEEPDEVLAQGVLLYKDVKARLDPTTDPQLTEEQADFILEAFKKKDYPQLRSCGSALLSSWLLSGAVRLSSSPIAQSKSSEPSPE